MKYINSIITIIVGTICLSACDLDEFPNYAIATQEGKPMIETIKDVRYFTNGISVTFRANLNGKRSYVPEVMCDAFNGTNSSNFWLGDVHSMGDAFSASSGNTNSTWNGQYLAIKDYNIFLEEIKLFEYNPKDHDLSEKDSIANINLMKYSPGYAHLYRAFAYMKIVQRYAKAYDPQTAGQDMGACLLKKWDMDDKPARSSVQETYDFIKEDIDAAAISLKDKKGEVKSKTPTIDCVYAMYAQYYLDIKDYAQAAKYAVKVIDSPAGYALASNQNDFMREYRWDNGNEAIMRVAGSLQEYTGGVSGLYMNAYYKREYNDIMGGIYFVPDYIPTKKLIDAYEPDDLRFKNWFTKDYVTVNHAIETKGGKFYTFIKFFGNPDLNEYYLNGIPNSRQYAKPFRINEMYLIAAEAYAMNGDEANAKTYLNVLQKARNTSLTDGSMENIKKEWFRETVGDGLRMICLKRWNDGFKGREPQKEAKEIEGLIIDKKGCIDRDFKADDYHWQWPIPSYELKVNKNLVQNPGYAVID